MTAERSESRTKSGAASGEAAARAARFATPVSTSAVAYLRRHATVLRLWGLGFRAEVRVKEGAEGRRLGQKRRWGDAARGFARTRTRTALRVVLASTE